MSRNPPTVFAFGMFLIAFVLVVCFPGEAQFRQMAFYAGLSAFALGSIW